MSNQSFWLDVFQIHCLCPLPNCIVLAIPRGLALYILSNPTLVVANNKLILTQRKCGESNGEQDWCKRTLQIISKSMPWRICPWPSQIYVYACWPSSLTERSSADAGMGRECESDIGHFGIPFVISFPRSVVQFSLHITYTGAERGSNHFNFQTDNINTS